ncbi:shikimate dehydrogenase [Iodidimonas sp. SYSU 1G8]|uniref:shikimate dehydrogenase n=1 Tax=Iodidimonas sp. SYSU 1G8 TaxID=3133967 RepID=UPI0031FE9671
MSSNPSILAGVIGWPIAHSRSPLIHGHWLQQHRISGVYIPLPVRPEDAASAIRALPKLGFAGVNATLPHKIIALDVADEVDALARRIGAANTLVVRDGAIHATNTDAEGFMENLRVSATAALRDRFTRDSQGAGHAGFLLNAPEFNVSSGPSVVLGAGGAARAILVALLDAGAPEIRLANRTRGRADDLAAELGAGRITVIDWAERSAALAGAALLVNTTSMGMHGQEPLEIALDDLPADAVVNDIVYAPLETGLLAAARAQGNITVDGLGMLLYQAVPGFEAWFGVRPAVTEELRAIVVRDLGGK